MMKIFQILCLLFLLTSCRDDKPLISLFPLKHYDQTLSHWISPNTSNYDLPVITKEKQIEDLAILQKHFFGTSSPWNETYVTKILTAPENLQATEQELIHSYSNLNKPDDAIQYGENFRKYNENWLAAIRENSNTHQFANLHYDPLRRAIAVDNLHARALPTEDPAFFNHNIAGQGYPFDNLQISAVWIGTPLYVLGETVDHAWFLVITPDFIGWVKSGGVAFASDSFIQQWSTAGLKQFIAITHTQTPLINTAGVFRALAYVGTLLPGEATTSGFTVMLPVADLKHAAIIEQALIPADKAVSIPFSATPHHFSFIMQSLLGRPYGWGNLYFYNDCSAELKNLFAAFGIWLPRHSSDQVYAGHMTDLKKESVTERINYLIEHGHPLSTLVYISGHILLFIGNYPNPNSRDHEMVPMTYQNMWGLRPHPGIRRAVVGKSVIFPLLKSFPEDRSLMSQASKEDFQVSQLDETSVHGFKLEMIDLKGLMYP